MNEWNLNIELKDSDILKIKQYLNKKIPDKFLEFIKKTNASFPTNDTLEIGNETYILNNILDFCFNSKNDNFYEVYESIKDEIKDLIPFGRDGMGNYFLIDLMDLNVYFYDHEKGEIKKLLYFDDFLKNLKGKNE